MRIARFALEDEVRYGIVDDDEVAGVDGAANGNHRRQDSARGGRAAGEPAAAVQG